MSNTIDDKELDDYLSGDTQYSRRYRAIAADAVPSELDSLVLANTTADNVVAIGTAPARANVARRKSLGMWMRVSVPVALAASFVLVFSIMMESGVRDDQAPVIKMDESVLPKPTSAPEAAANEQPVASPVSSDLVQEKAKEAASRRDQDTRARIAEPVAESIPRAIAFAPIIAEEAKKESRAAAPAPLAPAQANNSPARELEQIIVTGRYVRGSAENAAIPVEVISSEDLDKASATKVAGPRSTIPQSSFAKRAPSDAELDKLQRELDPAAWLAHIRDLRTSGKDRDADAEWQRFVKAYPNYVVDASDAARSKK